MAIVLVALSLISAALLILVVHEGVRSNREDLRSANRRLQGAALAFMLVTAAIGFTVVYGLQERMLGRAILYVAFIGGVGPLLYDLKRNSTDRTD